MALKALVLLLDPVSGQIESPLAMLREKRRAPTEAFLSLPFSPHQTQLHILTQNRVKEWSGRFEAHLNIV
jgi:hypothetical protein